MLIYNHSKGNSPKERTTTMTRTIINGASKIEIVEKDEYCEVTFFEFMGNRYVQFGDTENWSKELVAEEF